MSFLLFKLVEGDREEKLWVRLIDEVDCARQWERGLGIGSDSGSGN